MMLMMVTSMALFTRLMIRTQPLSLVGFPSFFGESWSG